MTTRRDFLKALGLGFTATAAGILVPELIKPERKLWAVSRAAPFASHRSQWLTVGDLDRLAKDSMPGYNALAYDHMGAHGPELRLRIVKVDDEGRELALASAYKHECAAPENTAHWPRHFRNMMAAFDPKWDEYKRHGPDWKGPQA